MYCPQCGVEYRDGFTECSDCQVALLPGTCPEPPDDFDPNIELAVILETDDRLQLALAKGVLEEAGIPYFELGQIARLVNDVDGFLHKVAKLQVPRDREAEAREILEQMLQPVREDPAEAEE